ncbi:hypothetical protein E2C01_008974 [Portunus trituberculatus]|uniref:Uncharacterized protein n=1 Tax=Portunus trituberculatus TaxID=210409 RepID=A0A5B7D491_PORTR|nr:hypothetical protein [Portunus trituberculatus]
MTKWLSNACLIQLNNFLDLAVFRENLKVVGENLKVVRIGASNPIKEGPDQAPHTPTPVIHTQPCQSLRQIDKIQDQADQAAMTHQRNQKT